MAPQTENAFRKLRITQASLSLLVLALAAALKVVVILYLQEKNDQVERAKIFNEALKQQNRILVQRVSEAEIVHGGNLYHFSCEKMSWDDANQYCVSMGSNLTSVEEQEFLYKHTNGTYYWIGLNNQSALGWQWTDGTPYDEAKSKEFWATGKPSNEKGKICARFWAKTQKSWNNYLCTFLCKFICEWNCEESGLCPNIQTADS